MSAIGVRREKAALSSGCETHPATAPAGSNRSSYGGNEVAEAFGYPGAAAGRTLRSASPSRISLPRKGCRVGLRIVLFEACSAFTRVTACTLALSPIRDTLIEGFSHFVTSMTA